MHDPLFASRERIRAEMFGDYWKNDLNDVFADVAPYYDRANIIASLGLWNWFRKHFMSMIALHPGQRVLDLCAGTALLEKHGFVEVRHKSLLAGMIGLHCARKPPQA